MPTPTFRPFPSATPWLVVLLTALFLVAATVPYSWLIAHFGYDDILREPTPVILRRFQAGGAPLVWAWFAFALSALLFIPLALAVDRLTADPASPVPGAAPLAIASAVAQAIGLMRWVLVVPGLASAYAAPEATPATQAAVVVVFDAVHHYGGMVIGEFIGQLLLAGWTALAGWRLLRSRRVPAWVAWIGPLTLPLWLLGQSELLHQVLPATPLFETVPLAFMAWEAWLLLLAAALLVRGVREWRSARVAPTACAS